MSSISSRGINRFVNALLAALLSSFALSAQAQPDPPRPNWDRDMALRMAATGDDQGLRQAWFEQLRSGQQSALLNSIRDFSQSAELSSPVRENSLFLFTAGLSDFRPEQIPDEVLEFLLNYVPQTLVAHEEDSNTAQPLFNIPAAAQGVRFALDRQSAALRSSGLLADTPAIWIENYLASNPTDKLGFEDALEWASPNEVQALELESIRQLAEKPSLTTVAARTALALGDAAAMKQILVNGSGPGVTGMLRSAAASASKEVRTDLLMAAAETAPPQNAALAIALLSSGLQHVPEVTETLFDLLADPELGAAAALALARSEAPETHQRLAALSGSDSKAAQKAALALRLHDTNTGANR